MANLDTLSKGQIFFFFVKQTFLYHSNKFSYIDIINMLEVLIDNIFVMFGERIFQLLTKDRRRLPLVEQELFSLSEHLCATPVYCGVCVAQYLLLSFFLLAIVLSVLLPFTAYDYPFGIFERFCSKCES